MEIHALRIQLTERDLVSLAQRALRDQEQLTDLVIRITPAGVVIAGTYRLLLRVAFETVWSLTIQSGTLAVTLRELRAGGVGAGVLKGVLMSMVQSEVENEPGVSVDGASILVDPDRVLAGHGILVRSNLVGVNCENGTLTFLSDCQTAAGTTAA